MVLGLTFGLELSSVSFSFLPSLPLSLCLSRWPGTAYVTVSCNSEPIQNSLLAQGMRHQSGLSKCQLCLKCTSRRARAARFVELHPRQLLGWDSGVRVAGLGIRWDWAGHPVLSLKGREP